MKRNRLSITFQSGTSGYVAHFKRNESFRCTSVKNAEAAIGKRNKQNIIEATFRDKDGVRHHLITS